ncbi:hypothetical protein [Georgenia thermotolerans]|uniref:Uncharacterized protein n=1 Tax=Georgenia thermotolerans TaxID=527326 RepID=A0A7J5USL0_9MICO|nr:hypothetical protein [Georgenia thermotolerans]KAE8765308.1 hypothetical protein GB883_04495 [Georgenia thermotolerans]
MVETRQQAGVSTGAGIAIAGTWFAGAAVTITILLIAFVVGDSGPHDGPVGSESPLEASPGAVIILFLIFAAPLIAAYSTTKLILGRGN